MKRIIVTLVLVHFVGIYAFAQNATPVLKSYEVNKIIDDFNENNFVTPENAAASILKSFFRDLSVEEVKELSSSKIRASMDEGFSKFSDTYIEVVKRFEIKKVWQIQNHAGVLIDRGNGYYSLRSLVKEEGRWLNSGENPSRDTTWLKERFVNGILRCYLPKREAVEAPERYIIPYVEYLKQKAWDPIDFVMGKFQEKKLVVLGEVHHRQDYWKFYADLVRNPEFAQRVGTIFLELGSNHQPLVDSFLVKDYIDISLPKRILRDYIIMGWPSQSNMDFFTTVWMVNKGLSADKKIQVKLVDTERLWSDDYDDSNIDRDKYMADQIYHHVERLNDGRSSLFIVGYMHATKNLENIANMPYKSAIWHLMNSMGSENLYSIFPHSVRMDNWGKTDGRLCLGLFDNAFELFGRRQFAFPLKDSPFGGERFDASLGNSTLKNYQDVYDAYLYLGKLDYELRSPLIAGFYSDGFAEEVDKRYDGWLQRYGMQEVNEKNLQFWMLAERINGRFYSLLGPINAWQLGDSWKDSHILRAFNNLADNPQQLEKDLAGVFDFLNQAHRMDSLAFVYSAELISSKLRGLTFNAHLYNLFKNHVIKDFLIKPQDNFLDNVKTNILKAKYSIVLDSKNTIQDEVELEYNVFSEKWEFKNFDWILSVENKIRQVPH